MVAVAAKELVLKPNRAKWLSIALAFAAALGFGVAIISERPVLALCFVCLGSVGIPFCVWAAFSSRLWLRLTEDGFSFGSLRRRSFYRWSSVARFGVMDFARRRHVVFVFSSDFVGEHELRRINQDFGRFDRFLPENYGMKHEDLAVLLEEWRFAHATTPKA